MAKWNKTFLIKDLFTDDDVDDEEASKIGKIVAARLRTNPVLGDENEDFAERFDCILDQNEFNDVLDEMYDLADAIRVWIE